MNCLNQRLRLRSHQAETMQLIELASIILAHLLNRLPRSTPDIGRFLRIYLNRSFSLYVPSLRIGRIYCLNQPLRLVSFRRQIGNLFNLFISFVRECLMSCLNQRLTMEALQAACMQLIRPISTNVCIELPKKTPDIRNLLKTTILISRIIGFASIKNTSSWKMNIICPCSVELRIFYSQKFVTESTSFTVQHISHTSITF